MTISFMRHIDYWLGIPICFGLSIFNIIFRQHFRKSRDNKKIKKILFLEFSEMGSAILSEPAIKKVKEMFPESELYYWIFESNKNAVNILNRIPAKNIITLRKENIFLFIKDFIFNLNRIRKENIDIILDLELFSRFSSIAIYLTGVKKRIGFNNYSQEGLYRGDLYTHGVLYNPYFHISLNFLFLVKALKPLSEDIPSVKEYIDVEGEALVLSKLKSDKIQKQHIWNKLKKFESTIKITDRIVVIHPSISEALPLRQWDFNNYIEVAKGILKDKAVYVVMVGALSGKLNKEKLEQLKMDRVINFIGETSMEELIDLFNISRALISHDSGMIHIASLTNVNILALFGPETPVLYGPLTDNKNIFYKQFCCSPCLTAYNQRVSVCKDNKCMQAISVEEVLESAYQAI